MKKGISDGAAIGIVVILVVMVLAVTFLFVFVIRPLEIQNQQLQTQNACVSNLECPQYSYCIQGTCIKPIPTEIQQNVGVSCDRNAECGVGLYCSKNIFGTSGECRRYGDIGDSCGADTSCMQGLTCQGGFLVFTSTCQPKPVPTTGGTTTQQHKCLITSPLGDGGCWVQLYEGIGG